MISGFEEENLEELPCSICLDENSYDDNEILFCDKCSVPVHQACYGVSEIPEGQWFCDVCAAGGNPKTTTCRLCSITGGAYKRTDDPNKWAHCMCMSWIPDCYFDTNHKNEIFINCSQIEKARFKLKCMCCSKPGVCIQCAYGRCCIAMHPSCGLSTTMNITRRIVKSLDRPGTYDWEMFCPQHADAVREPVKPKVKGKKTSDTVVSDMASNTTPKSAESNQPKGKKNSKLGNNNNNGKGSNRKSQSRASAKPNYSLLNGDYSDSDDNESHFCPDRRRGSSSGGGRNSRSQSGVDRSAEVQMGQSTAGGEEMDSQAILNLSDWPGQAEGEPLDLQHFWNVVSMMYPEDRRYETTENMLRPLIEMTEGNAIHDYPPVLGDINNTFKLLAAGDEELLSLAYGTDKERINATDERKMAQLLSNVASAIDSLNGAGSKSNGKQNDVRESYTADEEDEVGESELQSGNKSSHSDENTTAFDLTPLEYFTLGVEKLAKTEFEENLKSMLPSECRQGEERLCVVYDSNSANRTACLYGVSSKDNEGSLVKSGNSINIQNLKEVDSSHYHISAGSSWESEKAFILADRGVGLSDKCDAIGDVKVRLLSKSCIPDDETIKMHNCSVISRRDEDELNTFMRRDMKAYTQLLDSVRGVVAGIFEGDELRSCSGRNILKYHEMRETEERYVNQQIWKRVAMSVERGVRDQLPDFNRPKLDDVPASWTIKADGRADIIAAAEKSPQDEENEPHDDAVCMVCFDGNSAEGNTIIFCDGCNSPAHQACYGIVDIPEGEYFCDRCRAVQLLAEEYDDLSEHCAIKDIYRCCLCPEYHGALKATTDGRWVHLCCAIWCGAAATINSLQDMTGIDISNVTVGNGDCTEKDGSERSTRTVRRSVSSNVELLAAVGAPSADSSTVCKDAVDNDTLEECSNEMVTSTNSFIEKCSICNQGMGHLVQCCEQKGVCSQRMHPLCAWFSGYYLTCSVDDSSFLANGREDRKYPAGIKISVFCQQHIPVDNVSSRKDQSAIRKQYRIAEDDLDYVPGTKRRKSKKKKPPREATQGGRSATGSNNKELPVDIYDGSLCSFCLQPLKALFKIEEGTVRDNVLNCVGCKLSAHRSCARNAAELVPKVSQVPAIVQVSESAEVKISDVSFKVVNTAEVSARAEMVICEKSAPSHENFEVLTDAQVCNDVHAEPKVEPPTLSCSDTEGLKEEIDTSLSSTNTSSWLCDVCVSRNSADLNDDEEPRCQICPRRGGGLLKTAYGRWVHGFCADQLCNVSKDLSKLSSSDNTEFVIVKGVPSGKKQNCSICNRKSGVCIKCSHADCSVLFHPICAQRTGTHYLNIRNGTKESFCPNHIPDQVYRIVEPPESSYIYWINAMEVKKLRISLDRARVIMDMVGKRERTRHSLIRVEGEVFEKRFKQLCKRLRSAYNERECSKESESVADQNMIEEDNNPEYELTDAMKEVFAFAGPEQKKSNAPKGTVSVEDDDMSVDSGVLDFGAYNDNIVLSPGLMKEKKKSILGEKGEGSEKKKRRVVKAESSSANHSDSESFKYVKDESKRNPEVYSGFNLEKGPGGRTRKAVKSENNPADEFPTDSTGAEVVSVPILDKVSKRGRMLQNEPDAESMVNKVDSQTKIVIGKSLETKRPTEPRKLPEVKKFDIILDDMNIVSVDISDKWVTRSSRRLTDDDMAYYSTSDPKCLLNNTVLDGIVVQVYCTENRRVDAAVSQQKYHTQVFDSIDKKLVDYRELFVDREAVEAFGREMDEYIDYCMTCTTDVLRKEVNRKGGITVKKRNTVSESKSSQSTSGSNSIPEPGNKRKSVVATDVLSPVSKKRKANPANNIYQSPTKSRAVDDCIPLLLSPVHLTKTCSKESSFIASNLKGMFSAADRPSCVENATEGFPSFLQTLIFDDATCIVETNESEVSPLRSVFRGIHAANFTEEELLTVEYKCAYILRRVDELVVPKGVEKDSRWAEDPGKYLDFIDNCTEKVKGSRKKGSSSSQKTIKDYLSDGKRYVKADFDTFLYEDGTDIRAEFGISGPPLSLSLLKDALQRHTFTFASVWEFASDFYFMLNCYRRVSPPQSRVWWDTTLLSELFGRAYKECNIPGGEGSRLEKTISDICIDTTNNKNSTSTFAECHLCEKKYRSTSWPAASLDVDGLCIRIGDHSAPKSSSSTRKSGKLDQWSWLCPSCVVNKGADLRHWTIKVWWKDDATYYDGTVIAFDTFSLTHRIEYKDGEWEFVNLSTEPFLLRLEDLNKWKHTVGDTNSVKKVTNSRKRG